jgi:uncharacterized membrane protein YkvA (DUF1232 family)
MPLTISFQLSDRDLEHFTQRMNDAKSKAATIGEATVLESANKMLSDVRGREMPDFVRERIEDLDLLVRMVHDRAWNLAGDDRVRIVNAIAYVADPQDLIPDNIPGIGLLDDAVMIELVCQDLRHDIEAYQDFCAYRDKEVARRGPSGNDLTQESWLNRKAIQLHDRRRRRRERIWAARLGRSPFA